MNHSSRLGGLAAHGFVSGSALKPYFIAAAAFAAFGALARADIMLTPNFGVSGYAAGAYEYVSPAGVSSSDSFDLTNAKMSLNPKFDAVSASLGLYYRKGPNDIYLIDAYVSYDAGQGVTITGGRFLSYMGFEAFDTANRYQPSSAYINPHGTIMFYPAYHEGVKVNYKTPEFESGVALLDSMNGPTIWRGDSELIHNFGTEVYLAYTGVKGLTVWGGFGYDSKGHESYQKDSTKLYNLWVSYTFGDATVAAEIVHQDAGPGAGGTDGLVLLNYAFTKQLSTAFRISAGKADSLGGVAGLKFTKFTVSPSYAVTEHLFIRPEVSYIDYKNLGPIGHETYYAVQAVFKF